MYTGNYSRRGFLARSLAMSVGAGLPLWFAKENLVAAQENHQPRRVQPNSRIVMAAIGTGGRGTDIMRDAMRHQGVQFVAVCDVDRNHAERARQIVGRDCRVYSDYRELLQRQDIDAVTIGTPDHWHTLICIEALRRGKDVYCEKPLTLTIDEGKALLRVAQQSRQVFQTGSQQRTEFNGRFRLACELVRNGRVGRLVRIENRIGSNPTGGPFRERPVPDGLDWNFWLGQAPEVPYVRERCHGTFRWWYEYSGGKMTDWGAHHNDVAQWVLGMDESGPVTIDGRGEPPADQPNSFNCHPDFSVTYTYANGTNGAAGTELICKSRGEPTNRNIRIDPRRFENGVLFEGEDGSWIFVNREVVLASNRRLIDEPLPKNAERLERADSHMGNFLDCVRTRRQPICHAGVGHRSVSVCHLGNISIRLGRRLQWNPQTEQFVNDDEANRWLSRPMRQPWRLDV